MCVLIPQYESGAPQYFPVENVYNKISIHSYKIKFPVNKET